MGGPLKGGRGSGSRGVGATMVWAGRVEKGGAPRGTQTQKKWGFEGGGGGRRAQTQKKWGQKGGGEKGGGPKGGRARNFALFFPSPAAKCVLFFPLWGFSRGILVVFEAPGRSNVHVSALGLLCETPPAFGAAGASHDNHKTVQVPTPHTQHTQQIKVGLANVGFWPKWAIPLKH